VCPPSLPTRVRGPPLVHGSRGVERVRKGKGKVRVRVKVKVRRGEGQVKVRVRGVDKVRRGMRVRDVIRISLHSPQENNKK